MVEVSVTAGTLKKHSSGNQIKVVADLTSIDNNETFTVPHLRVIDDWHASPTTDDKIGGTVSTNVITFKVTGTLAANIAVYGR